MSHQVLKHENWYPGTGTNQTKYEKHSQNVTNNEVRKKTTFGDIIFGENHEKF